MKITPGNTDDRAPLEAMAAELEGKLLADKGYIPKDLFARIWKRGLHLRMGTRKKMKKLSHAGHRQTLAAKEIYH